MSIKYFSKTRAIKMLIKKKKKLNVPISFDIVLFWLLRKNLDLNHAKRKVDALDKR